MMNNNIEANEDEDANGVAEEIEAEYANRTTEAIEDEDFNGGYSSSSSEEVVAPPSYEGPFDFEIVGLNMSSNGRECCQHDVCGNHLLINDVVKITPTIINNVGGVDERALAVAKVIDGCVGCRVGFIPRVQATVLQRKLTNIGQCAIVKDIYSNSSNGYKVNRSKRNYGMASCILMSSIASYDETNESEPDNL